MGKRLYGNENCLHQLGDTVPTGEDLFCNATFDTMLCWPATPAGSTVKQNCPDVPGVDPTQYSFKRCGVNGRWEGRTPNDTTNPWGWTNYLDCFIPAARQLYNSFYGNKSFEQKEAMRSILSGTRTMEIVGLCISLIALCISSFLFTYFRSLRCNRTRIHRNLFGAMIIQVVVRLILYVDQFVARSSKSLGASGSFGGHQAIMKTAVLCEALYAVLEYTKSATFMWMFIEGFYLHNMVVVSVFSGKPNYRVFYLLGWGTPVPPTAAWVLTMVENHKVRCWYLYYFLPYAWILESQRLAVIIINLIFLSNIMRVLITKLRESQTNEAETVRKSVKAALVLLPLLGITNFVIMIEPPYDDVLNFGLWSYTSHFLISFQGFILALLYCFLNNEGLGRRNKLAMKTMDIFLLKTVYDCSWTTILCVIVLLGQSEDDRPHGSAQGNQLHARIPNIANDVTKETFAAALRISGRADYTVVASISSLSLLLDSLQAAFGVMILRFFLAYLTCTQYSFPAAAKAESCINETCEVYEPNSPKILCSYLPLEFLNCSEPLDLKENKSAHEELGYGCTKWGGRRYEDVQKTAVWCSALEGIECFGNRTFLKDGFPCIKYNGHYFMTTLIYSVLLGFLGMDRFCLGHTGTAVGKLLTLGGVGIWWISDVILLVMGSLTPEDGSNWVPYF